jgi:glycosyltransferase involved in cell wall biosynthesis
MPKKVPVVSVIIPAYNEEKNIGRLLESIQNQTYKHFEILVIDDASSDKTAQIAREYTSHVFERRHSERSVQRNFGARKSKGDYLLFLDADMELTPNVLGDCVSTAMKRQYMLLVIPEKTVGKGFLTQIRRFEREMYMGDPTIEVARFFDRSTFFEFGGYDKELTGPEDYDLPYRISKKYEIGRTKSYIFHHEAQVPLKKLLKRKYYYARNGAKYASKHPELVKTQGNLLFRKAYLRNWKKFLKEPLLGCSFIIIRLMESFAALFGFIRAVGIFKFFQMLIKTI